MKEIRQEFSAAGAVLEEGVWFVVFNVGEAIRVAQSLKCRLDFRFTPNDDYPSHSTMSGMPDDPDAERKVAAALKRQLTLYSYPALS